MKIYRIRIQLESPLVIADGRSIGTLIHGADHVPGATLRGGVSDLFEPNDFETGGTAHRIFAEEKVWFGPLYAAKGAFSGMPLPLSVLSCKYNPGFHGVKTHGIQDVLLQKIPPKTCDVCGAPLASETGYAYESRGRYYPISIPLRRIPHTAVSLSRQTADAGNLYTYEAIDCCGDMASGAHQELAGLLWSREDSLIREIERRLTDQAFFMGKAQTRGYGRVRMIDIREAAPMDGNVLKSRMTGLQDFLGAADQFHFTLTCRSPVLLLDPFLRWKTFIGPEDLAEITQNPLFSRFNLVRAFSSVQTVRGWNRAIGLPKKDMVAVCAGSAFLYGGNMSDEERKAVAESLEGLSAQGLGEGRPDGFGWISVCDPFHWQEKIK